MSITICTAVVHTSPPNFNPHCAYAPIKRITSGTTNMRTFAIYPPASTASGRHDQAGGTSNRNRTPVLPVDPSLTSCQHLLQVIPTTSTLISLFSSCQVLSLLSDLTIIILPGCLFTLHHPEVIPLLHLQ